MIESLFLLVLLQIAGIGVLMAEIILPSMGVLTVLALSLLAYSIYMVFTQISTAAGFLFLAADLVVVPVAIIAGFKWMARSPVTLRTSLSRKAGVSSQSEDLENALGKTGTAATDLRPSGTAIVEKKRIDVVTRGEYVDKGAEIVVIAVGGNRVVVRRL